MILQVESSGLAVKALQAGITCTPTGTGDQVLQFWELTLSVGEVVAVLIGFYFFFHIASFVSLSVLYRQKR
jgi:hypothetical protein